VNIYTESPSWWDWIKDN